MKYPKTKYNLDFIYINRDYYVGVAHSKEIAVFYYWDGVSSSYNHVNTFLLEEQVEL